MSEVVPNPDLDPSPAPVPAADPDRIRARTAVRWLWRRRWGTAKNAAAGFGLGSTLSAMTFGIAEMTRLFAWPLGLCIPLLPIVLHAAARHTCAREPAAPRLIAIGLFAGAVAGWLWVVFGLQRVSWPLLLLAPAMTIALPIAGFMGGRRGVAQFFGNPVRGVGDLCARCGYDLSGIPEGWPCSECGDELRYDSRTLRAGPGPLS